MVRQYLKYSENYFGRSSQSSSTVVLCFLIPTSLFLSASSEALIPYHGKNPFKKQTQISPMDSISSLRLCSIPWFALSLMYLTVPIILLGSYFISVCFSVLRFIYLLESPMSIIYIVDYLLPLPIRKFSGLISPCTNPCL